MISAAASNAAANANAAASVNTLSPTEGLILVGVVVAGMLLAGLVVILGRSKVKPSTPDAPAPSVIRSWIAISLVMGLLVLSAATFLLDDATVRSTLLGGLVTSVGGAIAFYFSSKAGDQTQAALDKANQTIANRGGLRPPGQQ